MLKQAFFAMTACVTSQAAHAAPLYLDCYLNTKEGKQPWSISLNEEQRTITFSHSRATATSPAIFTSDKVAWGGGDLWIDRTTLKFVRDVRLGGLSLGPPDEGMCSISRKKR